MADMFKTSTVMTTLANMRALEASVKREMLTGDLMAAENWNIMRSSREGMETVTNRVMQKRKVMGL